MAARVSSFARMAAQALSSALPYVYVVRPALDEPEGWQRSVSGWRRRMDSGC